MFDTRTGKLIYIASTDTAGVKLAVELDYKKGKGDSDMIVSGFRQTATVVAEMIKGGLYEVVK